MDLDVSDGIQKRVSKKNKVGEALSRMKRAKEGAKNEIQIKEKEIIYDEIDAEQYSALVKSRRDKQSFIEDDDGLGYDDYGEEDIYESVENYDRKSKRSTKKKPSGSDLKKEKAKKASELQTSKIADFILKNNTYNLKSNNRTSSFHQKSKLNMNSNFDNDLTSLENLLDDSEPPAPKMKKIIASSSIDGMRPEDLRASEIILPEKSYESAKNGVQPSEPQNIEIEQMRSIPDTEKITLDANIQDPNKATSSLNLIEQLELISDSDSETETEFNEADYLSIDPDFKTKSLPEGDLLVYWFDLYEDSNVAPGSIFLFGHLYDPDLHQMNKSKNEVSNKITPSFVARINNIPCKLYVVPKANITLQQVRDEILELVKSQGTPINEVWTKEVAKNFAFYDKDIPRGESQYLEVLIPFKCQCFDMNTKGMTFEKILGTNTSLVEDFLLSHDLWGPCWLSIRNAVPSCAPFSWCQYECTIDDYDDVMIARFSGTHTISSGLTSKFEPTTTIAPPIMPSFRVLSIHVRPIRNQMTKKSEILSVTLWLSRSLGIESSHIYDAKDEYACRTFVRKIPGVQFSHLPLNSKNVEFCPSETALLNGVTALFMMWDPDVILGNNLITVDLDLLLHRLMACKTIYWSRLSRLRRSHFAKSFKSNTDDSSWNLRQKTCGRLLCDINQAAHEFESGLKDYGLQALAKKYNIPYSAHSLEIDVESLVSLLENRNTSKKTIESALKLLVQAGKKEAALVFRIMTQLDVLPLTRQLTELAGNLWARSLLGARAERIEYLLLHKFYSLNYVLPDKIRSVNFNFQKSKPAYKGGLVLEPKVGLYNHIILLLDFNSLYPSIIQEHNICFTTVERIQDVPAEVPITSAIRGVLPETVAQLVQKRREVKQQYNQEKDDNKKRQLNVRQLAIKLVANSLYGCLGFKHSRFYAMDLAELVTRKGREALMKAQEITQKRGMDVIYGDTDSIMINTHSDDYMAAMKLGRELQKEISNTFSKLEMGIDGVFKKLLLLKKKKYAALEFVNNAETKILTKGIEIVRRDWCQLARQCGYTILEKIFNSKDVVDGIHTCLRDLAASIRDKNRSLEDFTIYKTLTKRPEDYPDAKNLPHVQVALESRRQGILVNVGEQIKYIICVDGNPGKQNNQSLAMRAFSPQMVESKNLQIDFDWYLNHQILPCVNRLCEHIEGTDSFMLASSLGIKSSHLRKSDHSFSNNTNHFVLPFLNYTDVETWKIQCSKCLIVEPFIGLMELKLESTKEDRSISVRLCNELETRLRCRHCNTNFSCSYLQNCLIYFIQTLTRRYYNLPLVCEDSGCGASTKFPLYFKRNTPLCTNSDCLAKMKFSYDQKKLYRQLCFLDDLTNVDRILSKIPQDEVDYTKKKEQTQIINALNETVKFYLGQNRYSQVDLSSLFSMFR